MSIMTASFAHRTVGCLVLPLSGRYCCQGLRFLARCGGFPVLGDGRGWTRYNYSMVLFSMNNLSVVHLISPIRLTDSVTDLEPVNLSRIACMTTSNVSYFSSR